MRILLSRAPFQAQIALTAIVKGLETRGLECCQTGEFWKTCATPIWEKWRQWKRAYDLLRLPPDPAWD